MVFAWFLNHFEEMVKKGMFPPNLAISQDRGTSKTRKLVPRQTKGGHEVLHSLSALATSAWRHSVGRALLCKTWIWIARNGIERTSQRLEGDCSVERVRQVNLQAKKLRIPCHPCCSTLALLRKCCSGPHCAALPPTWKLLAQRIEIVVLLTWHHLHGQPQTKRNSSVGGSLG